jgi:hypothetical protein
MRRSLECGSYSVTPSKGQIQNGATLFMLTLQTWLPTAVPPERQVSGLSASQIQFASSAASASRQFPFSFPGALLFDAKRGTTYRVV